MNPVIVSVDVPQDRARVYDFLDVMANHEPFTNHLMRDWQLSGPARGVGSKAQVRVKSFGLRRGHLSESSNATWRASPAALVRGRTC
jgi:hypothetical protein